MRLADRLGVDARTASQTYYGGLLTYIGCTADAEVAAARFAEGALLALFTPVMFGSPAQTMAGVIRALGGGHGPAPVRTVRGVVRLPAAARGHRSHQAAICEVGRMLTDRLGLPGSVSGMFAYLTERWDGRGEPRRLKGTEIPLALRIVHVATDAAFQRLIGGTEHAARLIRERAGHAFDPAIAALLADDAAHLLAFKEEASAWDAALTLEPRPHLCPVGDQIDRALAAGPTWWKQQLNFVVFGVLTLAFAAGLHVGVHRTRTGWLGPALLFVSGIGLLLAAAFPLAHDASGATYDPGGHFVAGLLFFPTSAAALVVLSRRLRGAPRWRSLATYTLAAGAAALAGVVTMVALVLPDEAPLHAWAGLAQRGLILAVLFPCRVVLGARLLREGRASAS